MICWPVPAPCCSRDTPRLLRGLAVIALRPGLGERIAPEILTYSTCLVSAFELVDHVVVEQVRVVAEWLVAPSSTIIAELSEWNSSKTLPTRFTVMTDGASDGSSTPNASGPRPELRHGGALSTPISAIQPMITRTRSGGIHRAIPRALGGRGIVESAIRTLGGRSADRDAAVMQCCLSKLPSYQMGLTRGALPR